MIARLILCYFIVFCLAMGIILTLLPWFNFIGDWGDNYLLAVVVQKTGMPGLQRAVASGWVRGAVTGLGILNIFIAFWEIAHFSHNVKVLEGKIPEESNRPK